MLRLGVVGPLPPVPSGPADYLAGMLSELGARCELTCLVEDPAAVDEDLRARHRILPTGARFAPDLDVVMYHLANNTFHSEVLRAALEGPPGILVVHDASLHHLVEALLLGSDRVPEYAEFLARSHGSAGRHLAEFRHRAGRSQLELFLFDLLGSVADRHLAVVTHSDYAADVIRMRAPGTPVYVVPLYARAPSGSVDVRAHLPDTTFTIGHFGYITPPKRPLLLLGAIHRAKLRGQRIGLVLGGKDDMRGVLQSEIARLGIDDQVVVTGYISHQELDSLIGAVDLVASFRSPHVGESSATLAQALGQGKPVIVQEIGSWAELPPEIAVRVPPGPAEEEHLANMLVLLAARPGRLARMGAAATKFAAERLSVAHCSQRIVDVAAEVAHEARQPALTVVRGRLAALCAADYGGVGPESLLRAVPPAQPRGRLLARGVTASETVLLEELWGYELVTPPASVGEVDVVVIGSSAAPGDAADELLVEANRVLVAGGLVIADAGRLAAGLALDRVFDAAGFEPVTACDASTVDGVLAERFPDLVRPADTGLPTATVVAGRKVNVPAIVPVSMGAPH